MVEFYRPGKLDEVISLDLGKFDRQKIKRGGVLTDLHNQEARQQYSEFLREEAIASLDRCFIDLTVEVPNVAASDKERRQKYSVENRALGNLMFTWGLWNNCPELREFLATSQSEIFLGHIYKARIPFTNIHRDIQLRTGFTLVSLEGLVDGVNAGGVAWQGELLFPGAFKDACKTFGSDFRSDVKVLGNVNEYEIYSQIRTSLANPSLVKL
jgi:hypothetical protein